MRIYAIALMLAATLPLCAQIDNGNITGRVTDNSGAVVPGAHVTLSNTETNFETDAVTNAEGLYRALSLKPGSYKVTVEAKGFKRLVNESVELRANSTLAVDCKLEVGSLNQSVEVIAGAQLLQTETSSSGASMEGDYFYSLPNYQRHATATLLFTPGVTFGSNQFTKGLGGLTINGLGSGVMGYFEDGALATLGARGDNSETVADSIEDIKVFTSAMPAEFGHSAGVGMSIVKKSGANAFHGTLSQQARTRSMQDRRFFDQYRNSQIQPGFSIKPPGLIVINPDAYVSGPVYIPKIYNGRNKTFFFYGFQMMIEKQGKQLFATVPTPAMLAGDFSFAGTGVTPNPIYDPETTTLVNGVWSRSPFPGNIIPASRISKLASTFLALNPIGLPNVPGTWTSTGPSNNVQLGPLKITKWQNHTVRLDHQISDSVKLFSSYTYNHEWGTQPNLATPNPLFDASRNLTYTDRHTGSLGATWVISPTTFNDFRASYYGHFANNNSIAFNNDYASLLGLGSLNLPKTCEPGVIPGNLVTDQSGSPLSPGCGSRDNLENYTVKDDMSKLAGVHSFKGGVEFLRFHNNNVVGPGNPDGSFTYSGVGGLQSNGTSIANTGGITAAQFLTGDMSGFSFSSNTDNQYTRSLQYSMYVQDDWKVSPTLTVNYGVRYNVEPPKTYKGGYISLFDLTVPDNSTYTNTAYLPFCPAGGCMGAYTHPKNATPFDTDWRRIDPVAGLAWHFTQKTVLRAGARIAHIDTFTDGTSLLFLNELLSRSYSASQVSSNFNPLFNINNGIPAWSYPALRSDGSTPTTSTNAGSVSPTIVPRNLKTPYVATWNIGIQRELSKDYVLEVRWEGSAQAKGYGSIDINTRPWGMIPSPNHDGTMMNLNDPANALYRYQWATNSIAAYQTQYARPYPNLGSISDVCNCVHTNHNAGIVSIQKRYSKGLNFQAYYTYSKSLGPSSTTNLNPYLDWHLYKARTGSDQTHNFTGTMTYELPVGKGRHFLGHSNRLVDAVLGGYNLYWTYTIASGLPTGISISGQSLPSYTAGGQTFTNINVPQYPGFMPNFGGVLLSKRPTLRDSWQDLGGDRFNQANQNSLINCGPAIVNSGNSCFTYVPAFSLGNNGSNVWNNQRLIAASGALAKDVRLKGDRMYLRLRLDLQNPFKWYNWGGPTTGLNVQSIGNSLTYGKINPASNGETATGTAGFGGTPLLNLTMALKW